MKSEQETVTSVLQNVTSYFPFQGHISTSLMQNMGKIYDNLTLYRPHILSYMNMKLEQR